MSQRAIGLAPRRAYIFDRETVIVGYVNANGIGGVAETRTGAARLLTTRLEAQDVFKVITHGTSDSAGTYTLEAASVPEGGALSGASTYAPIAVITCQPGINEIALTGPDVRAKVRAAGSLTGDVRVVAVRATAGTAANAPAGTNTIRFDVARA